MSNGNHRDSRGRYAPGNPGNPNAPGRPKRPVEETYLEALRESVPLDRWRRICDKAAEQAELGNHRAREWISHYLVELDLEERLQAIEEALAENRERQRAGARF